MRVSSIRLAGWRSFDGNGVLLSGLKQINIIIGQNNAGKSNFGKYFLFLKEAERNVKKHSNLKDCFDVFNSINSSPADSDTWAWRKANISACVTFDRIKLNWLPGRIPNFHGDKNAISLHADHIISNKVTHLSISIDGQNMSNEHNRIKNQVFDFRSKDFVDFTSGMLGGCDNFLYWKRFLDSIIFIDPIRHFDRASSISVDGYFDGAAIIKELEKLQSTDRLEWKVLCDAMKRWLCSIMSDHIENISIVNHKLLIDIRRGGSMLIADLSELGTGVAQIVMLLAHLHLNKEKEFNIFLDEPESNLHPQSVIRLIKIFENDFVNHNFFITTHSSALIDQVTGNWSVHRISREHDEASEVYSCDLPIHKLKLLDDLGIRASQLLQSNMVIWVEGPSDAIYLKKWISDVSNNELVDGDHYSFIFYGGSNLKSHTLLDEGESDSIDMMCTSRYVAIFCDTDYTSEVVATSSENLKPRVASIISRLKTIAAENASRNGDISNFVKIWLTEGRETENFVPKRIFLDILSSAPFCKSEVIENDSGQKKVIGLEIDKSLQVNIKFEKYESFDVCFSKMYKRSDGVQISSAIQKIISEKYAGNKVAIANSVVKKWQVSDYTPQLSRDITEVVAMIRRANGIVK